MGGILALLTGVLESASKLALLLGGSWLGIRQRTKVHGGVTSPIPAVPGTQEGSISVFKRLLARCWLDVGWTLI